MMQRLSIRLLYLYLFSFVGLLITVIGVIRLVDLGMKVFVFQGADRYSYYETGPIKETGETLNSEEQQEFKLEQEKRQEEESTRNRQREFSGAVSMIVVGIPLYLYHWKTIQKENKNNQT